MDFTQPTPAPYFVTGNSIYRQFMLPILVGVSLADELGLDIDPAKHRHDTFFSLHAGATEEKPGQGLVMVRPRRDGELKLLVRLSNAGDQPVTVRVTDATGKTLVEQKLVEQPPDVAKLSGKGYGLRKLNPPMGELLLPNSKASEVYRLRFEGGPPLAAALVLADAQIVHHVPEGEPLIMHDLAGQYYAGARFYTKTTADALTVVSRNLRRAPYTIRDAKTWELLFRSNPSDAPEQHHTLGKDRLIAFIVADSYPHSHLVITGAAPWFSATREKWFAPESPTAGGN